MAFFLINVFVLQEKKQKEALTRKQEKNRKMQKNEEDEGPVELLQKPREYIVKFSFPDPPPLQPPILGLHSKCLFFIISKIIIISLSYFHFNIITASKLRSGAVDEFGGGGGAQG